MVNLSLTILSWLIVHIETHKVHHLYKYIDYFRYGAILRHTLVWTVIYHSEFGQAVVQTCVPSIACHTLYHLSLPVFNSFTAVQGRTVGYVLNTNWPLGN